MWSLRKELEGVVSGNVSLLQDVFGFVQRRVPKRPNDDAAAVSLLAWAKLGRFNSFNLMTIFVGSESFTSAMFDEIDTAVLRMREIYGAIGIGVKWVTPWSIHTADADGFDVLTSEDDVEDLLSEWGFDANAVSLFFPAGWSVPGLLGKSALPGPCPGEQSNTKGMTGSCAGLTGAKLSSRTCSHEVGHFFGLTHKQDHPENLMCQTMLANSPTWQAVALENVDGDDQPTIVHNTCMVTRWWVI